MVRISRADSPVMSDEGERVRARRERLAMSKLELADLAGVSRDTLAAIEAGQGFRRSSLTKIEKALGEAEAEAGIDAPPTKVASDDQDLVEFRVEGVLGVSSVVVRGPVRDVREFEGSIARILRQVQQQAAESDEVTE